LTETEPDVRPQDPQIAEAYQQLRTRLATIRAENDKNYRALVAQREIPNPGLVIAARVDALLDVMLPPELRDTYDLAFEQRLSTVLRECLAQAREKHVRASAPAPSGRRASGLIVP